MAEQTNASYRSALHWLLALLLITFVSALYFVVRPFFTPLLWAIVLATATWPLFKRLRARLPTPTFVAPLVLTLILGAILLVAVIPLPLQLASEIRSITSELRTIERGNINQTITALPVVGSYLASFLESLLSDPNGLVALVGEHQAGILSFATAAARGVLSRL